MKDYAVQIKIKNNWMLTRMRAAGIESANQLALASGVGPTEIGYYLNLKKRPMAIDAKTGDARWRTSVQRISEVLKCMPEDLFPPQHIDEPLKRNCAEVPMSLHEVELLARAGSFTAHIEGPEERVDAWDLRRALNGALHTLTPREERVLRMRFGLGENQEPMMLEEVGLALNVTRERIRRIEGKALRKLKHPSRSRKLEDFAVWIGPERRAITELMKRATQG